MGLIRKWRYKWIKQDWMKLKEEIKYYKLVKNGKIIDNLLAKGFKLSEALELAELNEEAYNKFKAAK